MTTEITRYRGDTYPIDILVFETIAGVETPLDISGATFVLTVDPSKTPSSGADNLCALTGTITDAPAGAVSFYPTAEQMDHLGKFYYDVQMTDGSGKTRTLVKAAFKLTQDITKS